LLTKYAENATTSTAGQCRRSAPTSVSSAILKSLKF
jgi:hypothetical protein